MRWGSTGCSRTIPCHLGSSPIGAGPEQGGSRPIPARHGAVGGSLSRPCQNCWARRDPSTNGCLNPACSIRPGSPQLCAELRPSPLPGAHSGLGRSSVSWSLAAELGCDTRWHQEGSLLLEHHPGGSSRGCRMRFGYQPLGSLPCRLGGSPGAVAHRIRVQRGSGELRAVCPAESPRLQAVSAAVLAAPGPRWGTGRPPQVTPSPFCARRAAVGLGRSRTRLFPSDVVLLMSFFFSFRISFRWSGHSRGTRPLSPSSWKNVNFPPQLTLKILLSY